MQFFTAGPWMRFENWGGEEKVTKEWPSTWMVLASSGEITKKLRHIGEFEILYIRSSDTWYILPT